MPSASAALDWPRDTLWIPARISRFKHGEGDHRRDQTNIGLGRKAQNLLQEAGHYQIKPQQHHNQRHGTENVNVGAGKPGYGFNRRQAHDGKQRAPHDAKDHRGYGDFQGDNQPLHQVRHGRKD